MQTSERHGHLEGRALHAFPVEPDALNFPFARSLGVVRSEVIVNKTGETTTESRYYLSSQRPDERTPAQWHQLIRGHWPAWRSTIIGDATPSGEKTAPAPAVPPPWPTSPCCGSVLLALLPEPYPDIPLPVLHGEFVARSAAALRLLRTQ